MLTVVNFDNLDYFNCQFRINLDNEDSTRKWIADYNEKTKETMVFAHLLFPTNSLIDKSSWFTAYARSAYCHC